MSELPTRSLAAAGRCRNKRQIKRQRGDRSILLCFPPFSVMKYILMFVLYIWQMVMEAGLACAKANHRLHLHLHLSKKATLVLFLLLLSYGVGSVHCSTACRSWEARTPVCWWAGVRCGRKKRPRRVVELDLEYLFPSGTISPSLGNLMFLEELDLSLRGILRYFPRLVVVV